MKWVRVRRSDPYLRRLRDRHYSTKYPGGRTAGPPGRTIALRTVAGDAAWLSSWQDELGRKHLHGDAFVCSLFRNEGPELSSELVADAVAATRNEWGVAPAGFLTFVDLERIRRKRDPGRCFRRAGFEPIGHTLDRGLLVLRLEPAAFPDAEPALALQLELELDYATERGSP